MVSLITCYYSLIHRLFSLFKDGPEITYISDEQTLNKGDSVSLNCTADGNPTPSITWIKVSDNSFVSYPLGITGKVNEGLYRCTADNGIGSPVTKDVSIVVHCEFLVSILQICTLLLYTTNTILQ